MLGFRIEEGIYFGVFRVLGRVRLFMLLYVVSVLLACLNDRLMGWVDIE